MRRAQQGEEEAYAELLVLLTAATRSYVRLRLAAPVPWIDDVVQETLIAVHQARHTFDGRKPLAPWFYAIARNRFVDVLRREQRVREREVVHDVWPERAGITHESGSTVDIDSESAKLAANALEQQAAVQVLHARLGILKAAMGVSS